MTAVVGSTILVGTACTKPYKCQSHARRWIGLVVGVMVELFERSASYPTLQGGTLPLARSLKYPLLPGASPPFC